VPPGVLGPGLGDDEEFVRVGDVRCRRCCGRSSSAPPAERLVGLVDLPRSRSNRALVPAGGTTGSRSGEGGVRVLVGLVPPAEVVPQVGPGGQKIGVGRAGLERVERVSRDLVVLPSSRNDRLIPSGGGRGELRVAWRRRGSRCGPPRVTARSRLRGSASGPGAGVLSSARRRRAGGLGPPVRRRGRRAGDEQQGRPEPWDASGTVGCGRRTPVHGSGRPGRTQPSAGGGRESGGGRAVDRRGHPALNAGDQVGVAADKRTPSSKQTSPATRLQGQPARTWCRPGPTGCRCRKWR
jgi:hypothetical protein